MNYITLIILKYLISDPIVFHTISLFPRYYNQEHTSTSLNFGHQHQKNRRQCRYWYFLYCVFGTTTQRTHGLLIEDSCITIIDRRQIPNVGISLAHISGVVTIFFVNWRITILQHLFFIQIRHDNLSAKKDLVTQSLFRTTRWRLPQECLWVRNLIIIKISGGLNFTRSRGLKV